MYGQFRKNYEKVKERVKKRFEARGMGDVYLESTPRYGPETCPQPGCCECPGMVRCPSCGYTEHDKGNLMDHYICEER